VTDARRQPAALIGAKLVLLGALVWGVWRVVRAETGE
jgi:glucose dehydrogenase